MKPNIGCKEANMYYVPYFNSPHAADTGSSDHGAVDRR